MGGADKAKVVAFMILLVLLSGNAFAATLNITFDIQEDLKLRQGMKYMYDLPLKGEFNFLMSGEAGDIQVSNGSSDIRFSVDKKNASELLKVFIDEPTKSVAISFTVEDAVFKRGNVYHFFHEIQNETVQKINARVIIPENYRLHQNYMPGGGELDTDGERIMIVWTGLNTTEPIVFSVKMAKQGSQALVYLGIGAFAVMMAFIAFLSFYYHGKTERAMLKGFRDDEQKAISYIHQYSKVLQKDLQREFSFSRAKSTRIIKKLEEKGLVRKEGFGRTNRIEWVR